MPEENENQTSEENSEPEITPEMEQMIEQKAEERAEEKANQRSKKREKDKLKRGRAEALEFHDINPSRFDNLAEMDQDEFHDKLDQEIEKKEQREENLTEEQIEDLRSEIKEEVKAEYEPYKKRAEQLTDKVLQSEVEALAEDLGFSETVIDGQWSDEFYSEVKENLVFEDGEYYATDDDGNKKLSTQEGKDYEGVDWVLQKFRDDSKWSNFATTADTNGEPSGINENETSGSEKTTKSDFSEEEKLEYIKREGAEAWQSLPD